MTTAEKNEIARYAPNKLLGCDVKNPQRHKLIKGLVKQGLLEFVATAPDFSYYKKTINVLRTESINIGGCYYNRLVEFKYNLLVILDINEQETKIKVHFLGSGKTEWIELDDAELKLIEVE